MQKIRSSNPPVAYGICDPNKSRVQPHRSLKLGLKLKYLKESQNDTEYQFSKVLEHSLKQLYGMKIIS